MEHVLSTTVGDTAICCLAMVTAQSYADVLADFSDKVNLQDWEIRQYLNEKDFATRCFYKHDPLRPMKQSHPMDATKMSFFRPRPHWPLFHERALFTILSVRVANPAVDKEGRLYMVSDRDMKVHDPKRPNDGFPMPYPENPDWVCSIYRV